MSGQAKGDASPLIESPEQLVEYFRSGEKPREDWRIGTEHEKIGVHVDTQKRVPYEGERGIGALLERVAQLDSWERVSEGANVIALLKDGASITLEPGGQIELSGAPLRTLRETCSEFNSHLDLLQRAGEDLGIAWLALGADPFHDVSEIPHMPKARYGIMREYLPKQGKHGLHMMHVTATVQANFDFSSEDDMAQKMRTSTGVSPIISAIFANSPLSGSDENGFASFRCHIWRDTDPARCGILPFVFEDDFRYRDYAEWALDVPMFFLVRNGEYRGLDGTSFRQFVERGIGGERATLADWDLHLTTVFPEVRLKRYIEVRGADATPAPFICALPAIWKGIFYDPAALLSAWALVSDWTLETREEALEGVAREGLKAKLGNGGRQDALELARELVEISGAGLTRIFERGETVADENSFLEPLRATLEAGRSPAEEVLAVWREGGTAGAAGRLIDATRY